MECNKQPRNLSRRNCLVPLINIKYKYTRGWNDAIMVCIRHSSNDSPYGTLYKEAVLGRLLVK